MVAIIDYGMGNLASVQKALNYLSIANVITNDPAIIRSAASIILPGVGSFPQAMMNLTQQLDEQCRLQKKAERMHVDHAVKLY